MPSLTDIVEGKFLPPKFQISSIWKYEVLERCGKFIPTLKNMSRNYTLHLDKDGRDWHSKDMSDTVSFDKMKDAIKFCWFAVRERKHDGGLEKAT